jgi:hypothetical protein
MHSGKSFTPAAAAFVAVLAAGGAHAQQDGKQQQLPTDREEIVVTHQRLGPLSEWAQMQQHEADYQRLKAKFDPTTGSSHVDNWTSDRALASHNGSGDSFIQESADAPTPPAVQAVKDAVVPP